MPGQIAWTRGKSHGQRVREGQQRMKALGAIFGGCRNPERRAKVLRANRPDSIPDPPWLQKRRAFLVKRVRRQHPGPIIED